MGSIAGVSSVTTGVAQHLFGRFLPPIRWSVVVVVACAALLFGGHDQALDDCTKGLMAVLAVTTVVAVAGAVRHRPVAAEGFERPSRWTISALPFLIACLKWTPAPVENSVLRSLCSAAPSHIAMRALRSIRLLSLTTLGGVLVWPKLQ